MTYIQIELSISDALVESFGEAVDRSFSEETLPEVVDVRWERIARENGVAGAHMKQLQDLLQLKGICLADR